MLDWQRTKAIALLLLEGGHSYRSISKDFSVSHRDIAKINSYLQDEHIDADTLMRLDDDVLNWRIFPQKTRSSEVGKYPIDVETYAERHKKKRLMYLYLYDEYAEEAKAAYQVPYSYQHFCREIRTHLGNPASAPTARLKHLPGHKVYIDWAGDLGYLKDGSEVHVLIFTLPYSGYFYAQGFSDEQQENFDAGHAAAFRFFGGVPKLLIPDNAATVTKRGGALTNTELVDDYKRLAAHYGCIPYPTRPFSPREKTHSESAVNMLENWVIRPFNEKRFDTLEDYNKALLEKVNFLNARDFQQKQGSRKEIFEQEERAHLLKLPKDDYVFHLKKEVRVASDYHITFEGERYSVPYFYAGKKVDVLYSKDSVTIEAEGKTIATHKRSYANSGNMHTDANHVPDFHQGLNVLPEAVWSCEWWIKTAQKAGLPESFIQMIKAYTESFKDRPEEGLLNLRILVEKRKRVDADVLGLAATLVNERVAQGMSARILPADFDLFVEKAQEQLTKEQKNQAGRSLRNSKEA